ncbi:unnamed protein product [Rhodiola kirilowii]
MPFGLCNAPGTFQRCMMSIFSDYIEKCIEVFMDDFSIHGTSFDDCLTSLSHILARGVEVDKAKVQVIEQLPPPQNQKGIRSFLGHAGFYRRFIKDFSKIAKPLTHLLCNDVQFNFDEGCLEAFEKLKKALVSAPIVQPPNWDLPFELMCDASDFAIGAVLGQRVDKRLHVVYYVSKVLDNAQLKYTTTEKELLAVFNIDIKDKKGVENVVADHLSRVELYDSKRFSTPIEDSFIGEYLLSVKDDTPWYADYVNYLTCKILPNDLDHNRKRKFLHDVSRYYWDDPFLYKLCADGIYRKCVTEEDIKRN